MNPAQLVNWLKTAYNIRIEQATPTAVGGGSTMMPRRIWPDPDLTFLTICPVQLSR